MSASTDGSDILWPPQLSAREHSAIGRFARHVERTHAVALPEYHDLWQWSIENLDQFWAEVWNFFGVDHVGAPQRVLATTEMPGARWLPDVALNFVDRVFSDREPDRTAVVATDEDGRSATLSWAELEQQVAALAATLTSLGVVAGDRIVGYLPNCAATVVAFLAAASLGAVWSCCGQDYGAAAAAGRLGQLEPAVLVCADGYRFGGQPHDRRAEATELAALMTTLTTVIYVDHLGLDKPEFRPPAVDWAAALQNSSATRHATRVPFEHPLWVLYSSGTTGVPKAIVHSHGGVLLEGLKSLGLHLDVGPEDRLFWYTTTNWMMWNIVVEALLLGASIVVYDGNPAHPGVDRLWQLAAEHQVTVLGVSPGYLAACEKGGVHPAEVHQLSRLRLLGVTGAPVPASTCRWLYDEFDGRVPLMSLSGGTDVVSALAGAAPILPIRAGEIAAPALGVALDAFDDVGNSIRGSVGELVVTKPMPSMPVELWNDPDGSRYCATYFDVYEGVWRHGDWITITEHGGVVFHGRSDATLNRHGVRFGSADIYEVVDLLPQVRDSLVVGLDRADGHYWMPLFLVVDGELDEDLRALIKSRLRRDASPRHVPDEIIAVPCLPHTRTGKKLEVPIKRILLGAAPEDVVSRDAVDDPVALDKFIAIAQTCATES